MTRLLLIVLAGGAGSGARYLVSLGVQALFRGGGAEPGAAVFPVGTLAVNVIGCFCIGLASPLWLGTPLVRDDYRLALTVGLLGGFTTFSSFAWESAALARDGRIGAAVLNVAASNALGLLAVWAGYRLGQGLAA